ncbi:hypothetical protein F3Y22_tig00110403pilonHSYRG00132 [Hibiscus syriacus]|uniref:Uncharacterized protein n=1 Tax=Hibiscus syriacus TaxID=106335 RepID=A0A6A3AQI0_HIBSY|nr:hypothetical protein F3Y22_tig00110403pilonHSYRG00132 [Hibiscus syriacus]
MRRSVQQLVNEYSESPPVNAVTVAVTGSATNSGTTSSSAAAVPTAEPKSAAERFRLPREEVNGGEHVSDKDKSKSDNIICPSSRNNTFSGLIKIPVNDPQGMQILQSNQNLRREKPNRRQRKPVPGLFTQKRMKVSVGTEIDNETSIVRSFDTRVKRREKRVSEGVAVVVFELTEEDPTVVSRTQMAAKLEVAELEVSVGEKGGG